jgi:hypothetical protein
MSPDLTYYFALYLVEDMTGRNVLRRLQDFECPYVSIQRADSENRIQVAALEFSLKFSCVGHIGMLNVRLLSCKIPFL